MPVMDFWGEEEMCWAEKQPASWSPSTFGGLKVNVVEAFELQYGL